MKQKLSKKLEFWFHLGISVMTIGITFGMATFIFSQAERSTFPWWVYLIFSVYLVFILALNHALFCKNEPEYGEKSCSLPQKHSSPDVPNAACYRANKSTNLENNGRR